MDFTICPLFGLQSKHNLLRLLHIEDKKLMRQDYVASLVFPYIDLSGKPRLIEPPKEELKRVQARIKNLLSSITVPENVFSGIKGKSYAGNAGFHVGAKRRNVYKIDITAFFPSISRETVYRFFREDLNCSSDVSEILTNLTTVDLSKTHISNQERVNEFLRSKKITCTNHLMSGAPTSQILSYLVNHKMFDEMQYLSDKNHAIMTVYVDDVTFSSEEKLSNRFKQEIIAAVKKYQYRPSTAKTQSFSKSYPKVITGVVINKEGKPVVKNSLRKRIVDEYRQLLITPDNPKAVQRLRGLLTAARQVELGIFPTIHKFAFPKNTAEKEKKKAP